MSPGLKVALPSGPYEAKGLIKTAIRDDCPVVIFEDTMMYRTKVPDGDYTIPLGVAAVKRAGTDITIVATGSTEREDAIERTFIVRKPTDDGVVTSIEAFDAQDRTIALFFGARKPGQTERGAWRDIAESRAAA